MRSKFRSALATLPLLAASGCMSEDLLRYDGVTTSAGNAIAANTVMQMVDPWQPGVEDTRLITPADIRQYQRPLTIPADDSGSKTSETSAAY